MKQPLIITSSLSTDNWGLARIIRRSPPWDKLKPNFPVSTFFECTRDGTGVDLYLVDGVIQHTHQEFSNRITAIGTNRGLPSDKHGNLIASLSAGSTVGTARGATLWSCPWYGSISNGSASTMAAALNEVLTHYLSRPEINQPAVVNMSFTTGTSSAIATVVSNMIDAGMVLVAGAGNEGKDLTTSTSNVPAVLPDVIAVGASSWADLPMYYGISSGIFKTNFGSRIDITAPGEWLRVADNLSDDSYRLATASTSGAAAVVSGAIACMLQGHGRLTSRAQVQAVRDFVKDTATQGHIQNPPRYGITLPDRLLYLDPLATFEGLNL